MRNYNSAFVDGSKNLIIFHQSIFNSVFQEMDECLSRCQTTIFVTCK